MRSVAAGLILLYLLRCDIHCESENEWIDPFKFEILDVKEDDDNQSIQKFSNNKQSLQTNDGIGMPYYKRTINLILSCVTQESLDSSYSGKLYIDVSSEDYIFLKKFANTNAEEAHTLRKIDEILMHSIRTSKIDKIANIFSSWSDFMYYIIFNRITCVYLTIILILIVAYKLLRTNYSLYQVIKYLICLGYIIDFAFTWKKLLQELEIKKYADSFKYKEMPADCKLSEMSGWQFVLSLMSNRNNCKEYHKIILHDVFYDVGPLDVVSHQFGKVITVLGGEVGIALSKLTSGLMSDLPFLLSIILVPVLLIFILCMVRLTLSSLVTYKTQTNKFEKERIRLEARERKELEMRQHEFETTKAIAFQKHHSEVEKGEKNKKDKRIGFSTQGKYKKIFQHEKKSSKTHTDVSP